MSEPTVRERALEVFPDHHVRFDSFEQFLEAFEAGAMGGPYADEDTRRCERCGQPASAHSTPYPERRVFLAEGCPNGWLHEEGK